MLYTKSGDKGQTNIFAMPRGRQGCPKKNSKSSPKIESLGALDELNSLLGLCKVKSGKTISKILEETQNDLFIIQGEVAGCGKTIKQERVKEIEKIIDSIEKKLPKIKNFIIVGGTELSALLDYARAVARRAERRAVAIKKEISSDSLRYLNRLSSLLFAMARLANKGIKEKSPNY